MTINWPIAWDNEFNHPSSLKYFLDNSLKRAIDNKNFYWHDLFKFYQSYYKHTYKKSLKVHYAKDIAPMIEALKPLGFQVNLIDKAGNNFVNYLFINHYNTHSEAINFRIYENFEVENLLSLIDEPLLKNKDNHNALWYLLEPSFIFTNESNYLSLIEKYSIDIKKEIDKDGFTLLDKALEKSCWELAKMLYTKGLNFSDRSVQVLGYHSHLDARQNFFLKEYLKHCNPLEKKLDTYTGELSSLADMWLEDLKHKNAHHYTSNNSAKNLRVVLKGIELGNIIVSDSKRFMSFVNDCHKLLPYFNGERYLINYEKKRLNSSMQESDKKAKLLKI